MKRWFLITLDDGTKRTVQASNVTAAAMEWHKQYPLLKLSDIYSVRRMGPMIREKHRRYAHRML